MANFNTLFKQMFVQKRPYANLVLLLQVFAVIFLLVMALLDKSNLAYLNISKDSNWLDRLLSAGMLETPIADVIFVGLLCWQNEKINLSQTWQLAPASSVKIWLINMLSSLVECIYIFVIQVILGFVAAMIDNLSHHYSLLHDLVDAKVTWADASLLIEFLLFLTGTVLVIMTFVSFANFLTKVIVDQLPVNNNIVIKLFVMAVIVIIAILIAEQLNEQITAMYLHRFAKEAAYDPLGISVVEYFAGAIVLGAIDSYLMSKFVEPKIINR
ncbi:ABC transporter permease [Lactobacillus crispatus]|uniref:ABC transporter permease n=1 Tax=Lactobacillus crispatus TaxID=47770 RepID=UPI001F08ACAB|nr:ABC transporter permease [Lactobacillus crispatus]